MASGFLIGLKHATEADHLAAVSTIVSDHRDLWGSAMIGGLWGLGHTLSLMLAGVLVLLLNFEIGESTERAFEFGVGMMLIFLGLNTVRKLAGGSHHHFHLHDAGGHSHTHPHPHTHDGHHAGHHHDRPPQTSSLSPRSVLVGMVHGLAGSAALMIIVVPTADSPSLGLLYISIFGLGSIGGMMVMSFLVGLPYRFTALRFHRFHHLLQAAAGLISIALGLWIVYEKGVVEGLIA